MKKINLAITGCLGRMGQHLIKSSKNKKDFNKFNETLEKKDIVHKFLSLCSFVSICENKKLNLANVFLLVLKNKSSISKEILI